MKENYENIALMETLSRSRNLIVSIQKINALGLASACFLAYLEKQQEILFETKEDIRNGWFEQHKEWFKEHDLEIPDDSFIEELDKGWFELTVEDVKRELNINDKQINRLLNNLKKKKLVYVKYTNKRMVKLNHEKIKTILVAGDQYERIPVEE